MFKFLLFITFSLSIHSSVFSQENTEIFSNYTDVEEYKIVMKTQNFNGTEDIALDNLTIKMKDGEMKIYYIRYGDMLISSLTIPYSILERFIAFEKQIRSVRCESEDCKDSILIDDGTNKIQIPIDILHEELISTLMLELEQQP